MELALEVKFYLDLHWVTRPWQRTLINGSGVKYVISAVSDGMSSLFLFGDQAYFVLISPDVSAVGHAPHRRSLALAGNSKRGKCVRVTNLATRYCTAKLRWRCTRGGGIKSWPSPAAPNPTRAKFSAWSMLGIVWPPALFELYRAGLNLITLELSSNLSQVFHCLAISADSIKLSPNRFAIVGWLHGSSQTIELFSCELARLGRTVWPPARARFDFVRWNEFCRSLRFAGPSGRQDSRIGSAAGEIRPLIASCVLTGSQSAKTLVQIVWRCAAASSRQTAGSHPVRGPLSGKSRIRSFTSISERAAVWAKKA